MNKALKQEAIKAAILSVFPSSVSLNYVAYDDQLNSDQLPLVNDLLNMKLTFVDFKDSLYDAMEGWLEQCSASSEQEYKSQIQAGLESATEVSEAEVEEIMESMNDFILDELSTRNDSTPVDDLINNTRSQNLRVQMHSNFEGLDSGYALWRDGVSYQDYFKHIIDVLNLNPATLKKSLLEAKIDCNGRWPNCKSRNGKEYVKYEAFITEITNTTSNINTLTFVGKLDLRNLKDYQGKITFPAGNDCGLFDSCNGAGGVIEMELLRPMTIDFTKAQYGETEYDSFAASIDETKGYSIDSVYGVTNKFWGKEVTF